MDLATSPTRRLILRAAAAVILTASLAACGSSTPATASPSPTPTPPPTIGPSVIPSEAVPSAGQSAPAVDAAAGLEIGAPYTLTALPAALQQTFESQMAAGLGAFGGAFQIGFRQVDGGSATSILMVIGFPAGSLSATAYQAALAGMGSSMGTTFTSTTVDGIPVSTGTAATGGLAVFQVGDHMLVVISPTAADSLPTATALIKANQ
jgi:hypothetical protein